MGPKFPATHHRLLIKYTSSGLAAGDFDDRLMILMPPGSAKSTYASILFPSWWFTQHPQSSIIVASHSLALASYFSRRVLALVASRMPQLGYGICSTNRATDAWTTTLGGEFLAVGTRAAIAGRRADLIVMDDPVGSQADADSVVQRDHLWDWFRSDLIKTRLPPARPGQNCSHHDSMAPG